MEYGLYLALVFSVIALCVYKIRQLGEESRAERARRAGEGGKEIKAAGAAAHSHPPRRRDLHDVPTPWGWQGTGAHSASDTLHRWVDSLIAEKQTTDDSGYRERREASMRALLEDRFHSSGHAAMHGPKTADGNGSTRPEKGTELNGKASEDGAISARLKTQGQRPVSGVRTPWGW